MEALAHAWGIVHGILVDVSTVLTMVFIAIAVYSWIKHNEHGHHVSHEIKERFKHRKEVEHVVASGRSGKEAWSRIDAYLRSENASDWKVAILEADNLLEEIVTEKGYQGDTFGDKLKAIHPSDFPYLDLAWEAHKFRNDIAHTNRPLPHSEANRIIALYERVFREAKAI